MEVELLYKYLEIKYNGTPVKDEEAKHLLPDYEKLVLAVRFTDPYINYSMLSYTDIMSFSPIKRSMIRDMRMSPFTNILLIIYYDETKILHLRLMNGMATRLLEDVRDYMHKMKFL